MSGLGPCIRRLPGPGKRLYLTFDDGPDDAGTPAVLAALAARRAKATFFVVAAAARRRPDLVRRIVEGGHAVGNHSLDHRWGAFFAGRAGLLAWVRDAERQLTELLGHGTVGFRSPAGVRTPQLHWALRQLGLPLIHWNVRFYDAVWPWRAAAARASLLTTPPGSIVLLHDRQRPARRPEFLATLAAYLDAAGAAGFELAAITPQAPATPPLPPAAAATLD